MQEKKLPFKMGADPEFTIALQESRMSAKKLITFILEKTREKKDMGFQIGNYGEIGWDGEHSTAELRPSPEYTISKLTNNIGELIASIKNETQLFELSTKCDKAPIGGHIHFELNEKIKKILKLNEDNNNSKKIEQILGSFYIPLMAGEDVLNIRIRNKSSYGQITDFKNDQRTIEMRCPTAEWLITPKIAQATLAYLATVYNEIIFHPESFDNCNDIILKNTEQGTAIQGLIISRFGELTETIIKKIKKNIKTFEFYDTYKNEIDYILSPKKVISDKKKNDFDILNGWNMKNKNTPTKRDLMNEKLIKEKSKTINVDIFNGIIKIPYNKDDTNVNFFVDALKNRIISMNWKLNHNYLLYGLRKGIKKMIICNYDNKTKEIKFYGEQKQIKTQSDLYHVKSINMRMLNKLIPNFEDLPNIQKYILIGIPYEQRIEKNIKEMINTIYQIEKNKIKEKSIKQNDLNEETKGNITKLYENNSEQGIESNRDIDTINAQTTSDVTTTAYTTTTTNASIS